MNADDVRKIILSEFDKSLTIGVRHAPGKLEVEVRADFQPYGLPAHLWNTHANFDCETCGKHWGDFRSARKLAYAHAKRTSHKVRGEIGAAYYYN